MTEQQLMDAHNNAFRVARHIDPDLVAWATQAVAEATSLDDLHPRKLFERFVEQHPPSEETWAALLFYVHAFATRRQAEGVFAGA